MSSKATAHGSREADEHEQSERSVGFFFDYCKRIRARWSRVFSGGDEEGDDDGGASFFGIGLGRYGWLHIIESLSDRDITKWDQILERRASEIFTHLTYLKDYNQMKKQMLSKTR